MFANHLSDRGLGSRIYKEIPITQILQLKNEQKTWVDVSPKKNTQMATKHMERCSTSLAIREMKIKTTARYYFMLAMMAIIKKDKCW